MENTQQKLLSLLHIDWYNFIEGNNLIVRKASSIFITLPEKKSTISSIFATMSGFPVNIEPPIDL